MMSAKATKSTAAELYRFLASLKREERLYEVIFFVTSVCNAKCRTCFYWKELNRSGDLSLDEIKTLTRTMPSFHHLILSGGEPTLRRDLPEIVRLFSVNNHIRFLNFPTNGLKPIIARDFTRRMLVENPQLTISLNFSVDGLAQTHDRIRGVPGNFHRIERAIEMVQPLRREWGKRLWVGINTTICRENYREVVPLAHYFLERELLDGHYFQIIRGDPLDPGLKKIPGSHLRELYSDIVRIQEAYAARAFQDDDPRARWLKRMIYVGTLNFHHRIQFANYTCGASWPMPCTAGQTSIVIDYNGDVRACELRGSLGNLRDYDLDFRAFWQSVVRAREVEQIERDRCFCTHVCFIHDSMRFSLRAQLLEVPKSYMMRHAWQRPRWPSPLARRQRSARSRHAPLSAPAPPTSPSE
ncbi:MAG: radical SAM protein [Acidobacteria bacterium]|nr:MAG: radical SAM protein [Acidobacteriota bacterium]